MSYRFSVVFLDPNMALNNIQTTKKQHGTALRANKRERPAQSIHVELLTNTLVASCEASETHDILIFLFFLSRWSSFFFFKGYRRTMTSERYQSPHPLFLTWERQTWKKKDTDNKEGQLSIPNGLEFPPISTQSQWLPPLIQGWGG